MYTLVIAKFGILPHQIVGPTGNVVATFISEARARRCLEVMNGK